MNGRPVLAGAMATRPRYSLAERLLGRPPMPWSVPDELYVKSVVRRRTLFGDVYLVSDPEIVKRVLVDQPANYPKGEVERRLFCALLGNGLIGIDGELWRTHRRIMAPPFAPSAVEGYDPMIAECVNEALDAWEGLDATPVVEMSAAMSALTLRVICRTMFSGEGAAVEPLLLDILGGAPHLADFGLLDMVPGVRGLRMRRRLERFSALFRPLDVEIRRMVAQREVGGSDSGDLLQRLIEARDEETGGRLTNEEVRDELVTMFVGGHDTTATALTWIWYLLAMHSEVADALRQEIDLVLGGRHPTSVDLRKLILARQVADEALRLYPPFPNMAARVPRTDQTLGGLPVKAGSLVVIVPWALHRNRAIWDDPECFKPDRFTASAQKDRHRLSTLPFGGIL